MHENFLFFLRKKIHLLFIILTISSMTGCTANMVLIPELGKNIDVAGIKIKGTLKQYDGNREYLPRTLDDDPTSNPNLYFHYEYQVIYGKDSTHQAVYFFNPLTIVGFPIGEDTLVIEARLIVFSKNQTVKEYKATCAFQKVRSIFSEGETFSELRKKGLLLVRDNIEAQMCHDKDFLLNFVRQKGD